MIGASNTSSFFNGAVSFYSEMTAPEKERLYRSAYKIAIFVASVFSLYFGLKSFLIGGMIGFASAKDVKKGLKLVKENLLHPPWEVKVLGSILLLHVCPQFVYWSASVLLGARFSLRAQKNYYFPK